MKQGETAMSAENWMPAFDLHYYLGSGWTYLVDEARLCLRAALETDPAENADLEAFVGAWVERACEVAERRRSAGREVSQYAIQLLYHETKGADGLARRLRNAKGRSIERCTLLHHAGYWLQDRRRELLHSECGHSEHRLKTWRKIQRALETVKERRGTQQIALGVLNDVMHALGMKLNTLLSYLREFEPSVEFDEAVHGVEETTPLDLLESQDTAEAFERRIEELGERCFAEFGASEQRLALLSFQDEGMSALSELERKRAGKVLDKLRQSLRNRLQETTAPTETRP